VLARLPDQAGGGLVERRAAVAGGKGCGGAPARGPLQTSDAASTLALFDQPQKANPTAPRIVAFCDNARYYKSKGVAAYLKTSRIHLEPFPAYSQNLNLIGRFWKFFKKQVPYNRYYERFSEFREA
jgi:transposase